MTDAEALALRALADRVLTESVGVFVDLDDRNTLTREIRLARGVQVLLNERDAAADVVTAAQKIERRLEAAERRIELLRDTIGSPNRGPW